MQILSLHHAQITFIKGTEEEAKHIYHNILGFRKSEIPFLYKEEADYGLKSVPWKSM
jgi:hypothetical protein